MSKKFSLTIFHKKYSLEIVKMQQGHLEAKTGDFLFHGGYKNSALNGKGRLVFIKKNTESKKSTQSQKKPKSPTKKPKEAKIVEGEWKNGKLIKGEVFDHAGKLMYQGQFKNGLYHGKGAWYLNDPKDKIPDEKYVGEFKNGTQTGKGEKYIYYGKKNDFEKKEGQFKDGKLNGKGKIYFDMLNLSGKYVSQEGNFKNGSLDGFGKMYALDDSGPKEVHKLASEGYFKNGYLNGKGTEYDKYGNFYKGSFKLGRRDGKGITYYSSGKKEYEGTYKEGRKNGIMKMYYDNEENSLRFKGMYKMGRRKGKGISYYSNGNKQYVGTFNGSAYAKKGRKYRRDYPDLYIEGGFDWGEVDGPAKFYYHPGGVLSEKGTYKCGYREGLCTMYYQNGKVKVKANFKNGETKGKGIKYWENGNVKEKGTFSISGLDGKGIKYFENGKIQEKGIFSYSYFKKGTRYFEDGQYVVGTFQNGVPHGKCTHYWANKKKRSVGVWERNRKNGLFMIYHENGKLAFRGIFKNGLKEGKGIQFDFAGKMIRKGYWEDDVYVGKASLKQKTKINMVLQNNIKKYLEEDNKDYLKKVDKEAIILYLKKYAKKDVQGSRAKVIKQLQQFRKQLKKPPTPKKQGQIYVYDAYQMEDVKLKDFLKEPNRIVLVDEKNFHHGVYLEQYEVLFECIKNTGFSQYLNNPNVKTIFRLPTAAAPIYQFYKTDKILKGIKEKKNLFYIKTFDKDIKVLSKAVAEGANMISRKHCDPKDIVRLSETTKMKKIDKGLHLTIDLDL